MPIPYSVDLRKRVLAACEAAAHTRAEIARQFRVSPATLYNWLKQAREAGRTAPKPARGGLASQIGPCEAHQLRQLVEDDNDRTLAEYTARLREASGVAVSPSTISRALKRLRLPRKKTRAADSA